MNNKEFAEKYLLKECTLNTESTKDAKFELQEELKGNKTIRCADILCGDRHIKLPCNYTPEQLSNFLMNWILNMMMGMVVKNYLVLFGLKTILGYQEQSMMDQNGGDIINYLKFQIIYNEI